MEWRAVKGFEGIYEISEDGKIKSLARQLDDGRNWKERIFKDCGNRAYYCLKKDNVRYRMKVSDMLVEAYGESEAARMWEKRYKQYINNRNKTEEYKASTKKYRESHKEEETTRIKKYQEDNADMIAARKAVTYQSKKEAQSELFQKVVEDTSNKKTFNYRMGDTNDYTFYVTNYNKPEKFEGEWITKRLILVAFDKETCKFFPVADISVPYLEATPTRIAAVLNAFRSLILGYK